MLSQKRSRIFILLQSYHDPPPSLHPRYLTFRACSGAVPLLYSARANVGPDAIIVGCQCDGSVATFGLKKKGDDVAERLC